METALFFLRAALFVPWQGFQLKKELQKIRREKRRGGAVSFLKF